MPSGAHCTDPLRRRLAQAVLVLSTLAFYWYAMMAIHEAGHVLNAVLSGGTVARVVLPVVGFSRTDLFHDPHPLFVVCGGPFWGCILPLALWGVLLLFRNRCAFLARFFAGFCTVTNGVYIGAGSFWHVGDAGDLLNLAAPRWALMAFGAVAVSTGLLLWNGLGPDFGSGAARGDVNRRAALLMPVALAVLLVVVALFG